MARETTYAGMLGDLAQMTAALAVNAGELPHLEGVRLKLDASLTEAQEIGWRDGVVICEALSPPWRIELEGDSSETGV